MRRNSPVCVLLIIWTCPSPLLWASVFNAEVQDDLYTIRRASPPAAGATIEELERMGDQLRAEEAILDALDYYQAALAKKPDNSRVLNKRGIAQLQMKQYKLARKDFEKAIKLERTFASSYNNLGAVYFAEKKYGAAIKQYQKAIQLAPGVATYYANMGTAYFAKNEFELAGRSLTRAMELDPDVLEQQSHGGGVAGLRSREASARYNFVLARLSAANGANDRSLEYLKRAIDQGYQGIEDVFKDSAFAGLRKDPRFAELMAAQKTLAYSE